MGIFLVTKSNKGKCRRALVKGKNTTLKVKDRKQRENI